VHHCSVSEGKLQALQYDVVFTARNFVDMFETAAENGVTVIGLKNIMSAQEIEEQMREKGIID